MDIAILVLLALDLGVSVLTLLAASRHEKLISFVVGEIQAIKRAAAGRRAQLQ